MGEPVCRALAIGAATEPTPTSPRTRLPNRPRPAPATPRLASYRAWPRQPLHGTVLLDSRPARGHSRYSQAPADRLPAGLRPAPALTKLPSVPVGPSAGPARPSDR